MKTINNYISEKLIINKNIGSFVPKLYKICDNIFDKYIELKNYLIKYEIDDEAISFINKYLNDDLYPLYVFKINTLPSKRNTDIGDSIKELKKYLNIDDTDDNMSINTQYKDEYKNVLVEITYYKKENFIEIYIVTKNPYLGFYICNI